MIHPQSLISPSADIGEGGIVGPGVVIGAKTRLSSNVLIGRGVPIGHHVEIALDAVVNPGANIAGNVNVDAGAQIGMGAIVVNGVSIGDHAGTTTHSAITALNDPRVSFTELSVRFKHPDPSRGWDTNAVLPRNEALRKARGLWT